MEIAGKKILIMGGPGLVGVAVARELLSFMPAELVLTGLTRREAEQGVAELEQEGLVPASTTIVAEWGDLFVPASLKDRTRAEIVADPVARAQLLDDLLGELSDEVVQRSSLGSLLLRRQPDIIVDCVNTATAFAYQNIFQSAAHLRAAAASGSADTDAVERHLATLYLPQLIRHVQVALDAMRRAGTGCYVKVGTAGTGGMGLNIPFTHSEERPSRMLLAKSGLAGAQSLLLYLMARTPGAPAIKEIKPTAAISWKGIGAGEILRAGRPIPCFDSEPQPLAEAFAHPAPARSTGDNLRGVYVDAGENGWFTAGEFETLTALGLMEFITPEEIAADVVREIRGMATGHDIVAALDAATSGPTYRAGVLREAALERMDELERQHGVRPVAYEMLGPPRLSKLLFEGELLARLYPDLRTAARLDAEDTAERAEALLLGDADLRVRMLSIGIPILLRDGTRLLRGPQVRVPPAEGQSPADPRLAENGWVDLRPANWRRWRERSAAMVREIERAADADGGSRFDFEPGSRRDQLRPGRLAAWIFRIEDRGSRIKR
ncbi:MAG: short-chain dehydrogenase [Gemmatimonadetes bacterium]|nr:short-chain dehydrogenase [Gemmatimonadota bacterium]